MLTSGKFDTRDELESFVWEEYEIEDGMLNTEIARAAEISLSTVLRITSKKRAEITAFNLAINKERT